MSRHDADENGTLFALGFYLAIAIIGSAYGLTEPEPRAQSPRVAHYTHINGHDYNPSTEGSTHD
jgi:hypothetical protein